MKKDDLNSMIREQLNEILNEKSKDYGAKYAKTIIKILDDDFFYSFKENLVDIIKIVHENIDDIVEQHGYYGLSRENFDATSKYLTDKILKELIKLNKGTSFETEYSKEYDDNGKYSVK